ncbi:hypothetical protein BC826DRAFT_23029 [Russula brevipes]|nr:hypothetical protein BC826DRAFT_23029 [Russula brevipes]
MSCGRSVFAHAVYAPGLLAEVTLTRFKVKCFRCSSRSHCTSLILTSTQTPTDALKQVMDHISQCSSLQKVEGTSTMCSDLSLRTCWLAAQLLNPCHSWHVAATPNLIKSMCCTFIKCMIEGGNLEAREALIEGLTHVAVDELRAVIQTLQDDKQSRFFYMFDNMIEFLQKTISSASRTHAPLTSTMIRTTRLMMNFLTLCCNASRLCCGVSVSALLTTVAAYASKLDDTLCLSCHLLTSFSSLEGSRADILLNKSVSVKLHKVPWEIALSCPRSDILVASCLASCVLALKHLESPHPSIAVEIWDYLRDVLILILTEHYIEDEAPLGFLVAPTLCEALLALLRQMGDLLVTWALCSPWAKDFCMELRALLRGNENGLSKTRVILKRRLSLAGRRLIEILENGREGEPLRGGEGGNGERVL